MGFTDNPIINSPFEKPQWHYELDPDGQPTGKKLLDRRKSSHVVPVPMARRRGPQQRELELEEKVTENVLVNEIRQHVDQWRGLPPGQWGVTPETQRLLLHWRDADRDRKLFFCQREAVETLIWLTEVEPKAFRKQIDDANAEANPGLYRLACKMATGAGKTTVMAMIIAWHAANRARRPGSRHFSDAFLIVTPGITIKDRLRVLLPQDPQNIYEQLDLVPHDLMDAVLKARIVITNYHACMPKEKEQVSKLNRQILGGREGEKRFTETPGEMIARVGGTDLLGRKNIIVLNDEAHHCYRRNVRAEEEAAAMTTEERAEADENEKAARVWISGLEAFADKVGVEAIYDLSATPFFLRGSGYDEGKLFPWVVSDFGLLDAIESGIVKVPRLPVLDDAIKGELPKFRNVYNVIRKDNPRAFPMRGRRTQGVVADASRLPHHLLEAAIEALYKHYDEMFAKWEKVPELGRPPVFIVVCNNTSTSKLVYDWISGYDKTEGEGEDAKNRTIAGKLPLFSNVDENGRWRRRFRTFLIDSSQLESGEALSDDFRKVAAREIEEFKKEKQARGESIDEITDADLLREVMNTIGKPGRLGADIRCVVSVSMLTEGWDANTVTHIMGVRAFGTQLLCEQVVGRGLRRVSYEIDPKTGFFPTEYAEVLGVPFSFAQSGGGGPPPPPPRVTRVRALAERRKEREIRFPNVEGYRVVFPRKPLEPEFTADSRMELTPDDVPNVTESEPLIGEGITFDLRKDAERLRLKSVVFDVAGLLLREKFPDQVWRYPELVRITERWFEGCLTTKGKTPKQYLKWRPLALRAVSRIYTALVGSLSDPADGSRGLLLPIINPLNPEGSTRHVDFTTSKQALIPTTLSHVNYVVYDRDWEAGFTERLEKLGDIVVSYVKNHSLHFEVPYEYGGDTYRYRPDFIVRLMGAKYDYYLLKDSKDGAVKEGEITGKPPAESSFTGNVRHGFVYERAPHVTLKSIANNAEIDVIWERWQKALEPLREKLNKAHKQSWEEWQVPRETDNNWSDAAKQLHAQWWEARRARQKEIDDSIARNADIEYLYDRPYKARGVVRVAGPFTVESLSPHRVLPMGEDPYLEELLAAGDEGVDARFTRREEGASRLSSGHDEGGAVITDFAQVVYENLKTSGVQNTKKGERLMLENLRPFASRTGLIQFEGRYLEKGASKRAAVCIGPEYDTVGYELVRRAAREAADLFDTLIICGFAFAPEVDDTRLNFGALTVLKARMNQDLRMADKLKATGAGNLFVVFGEPDIVIHKRKGDLLQVEIRGMDIFDPTTGEVRSSGGKDLMNDVAAWFIDHDYDEESFFVRQAYFVGDDPYDALKRALKAEIDETAWAELNSTISRPFPRPDHGRICVKVINHFGDEVQKVFQV